ncbi:predicted protein [Nematostella vectensis]|uniref:Piezo non-specific cation channel R-Ras-binding domain-containing protein n=1 Tax=Nematostella vectensis TaxID=45351 RepID=A7T173_NEMVE|nr:predicted protein [Nematostella vectensis]|eukprot:XP_001622392.1 predicted protein [Nematostella vectensis]
MFDVHTLCVQDINVASKHFLVADCHGSKSQIIKKQQKVLNAVETINWPEEKKESEGYRVSDVEDSGESLWNKICRSVKAFLNRIYDPETWFQGRGQKYWMLSKWTVGGLLVALLVIVIWFPLLFMSYINSVYTSNPPQDATFTLSIGGYQPQRQAQFVKIVEENVVPKTFLYMLLSQFFLIIIDRCLYLRKYVFAKLFFLLFLTVSFHVFMFIVVPYVTKRPFFKNIPAIFMYIFMCMYFGLSAYQVRSGYPTRILGNFLTKSYTLTSGVLFQGFQAIPFLLELRSVLDWVCTDTTLTLYHWLKMEDIYANIYVLKCYRESEKTWFQGRGQKYWMLSKWTVGGLLVALLVIVIWFPLLFMSYINSVYTSNPPQDATFTLSIGGYQPLFRVSAQEQFLERLNNTKIDRIKTQHPGLHQGADTQPPLQVAIIFNCVLKIQIDTFLADYHDRGTVVLVKITGNSSSIWQISPPSRQLMMHDLLGEKNVTLRFKYEFTRIIGLYVGFVWLVGKFVRLFFTSISYRIMFDEMPNVDKVLKLCLDIFMVRESKSFKLEEDLFAKLMFLYRSPETLIKWTKYKRA